MAKAKTQAGPGNAAGQGGGPGGGPGGGAAGGPGGVFDDVTGTQCNASMDEQASEAQYTQEQLSSGEVASVTYSGTITCSSCTSPLTLRVGLQPTDGAPVEGGPSILTSIEVQPNAAYEVKVPKATTRSFWSCWVATMVLGSESKTTKATLRPALTKADWIWT